MSKKKKIDKKSEIKKDKNQIKKDKNPKKLNILNIVLIVSLILNFMLGFLFVSSYKSSNSDLYSAIGKGAFTANSFMTLRDDEDPKFSIKTAQLFDNRTLRIYGYTAVFDIENFPACSIITDTEAKVISLGLLKPLYIGGTMQDVNTYFSKFYGLGLQAFVGNEGIFKPDDQTLELFAEKFKSSFIKTLKLLFIKVNGRGEFDQLYPNGIFLASVGDKLKTFSATDISGKNVSIADLQGKKNAIIYVDSGCGSCKAKCGTIRDILKPLGVNIIFVSQGTEEEAQTFMKDYLQGEQLIVDEDNKVANTLYLGEAPYLMLIDKDLTINFKGHINDVALDAEPAINKFVK